MTASSRNALLFCLLLTGLTVLAYTPAMTGDFLWDDDDHISKCRQVQSPTGLYEIWLVPRATMQYYPLTFTVWWVIYHLWGLNVLPYHLVTLLLHAGVAILLWRVLKALRVPGAWLAGLIFAVHPVHVMSVAWMTELKNTLSGVLFLGSLWAYLRFARIGVYGEREEGQGPGAKGQEAMTAAGGGHALAGAERREHGKRRRSSATPSAPAATAAAPPQPHTPLSTLHSLLSTPYLLALGFFLLAMFAKTATSLLVPTLLLVLWWRTDRLRLRDLVPLFALVCTLQPSLRALPLPEPPVDPSAAPPLAFLGQPASRWALLGCGLLLGGLAWLWRGRISWRTILPILPFAAIAVALGRVTLYVEHWGGATGPDYALSFAEKALVAGRAFWFYAGKLLFPYPLTFIYPRWVIDSGAAWQYAFPAAFVLLVAVLWGARRRWGVGPLVAVIYSFIGSAGLILIVVTYMTRYSWVADHWQYMGSMSLIALFAAGLARFLQRREWWGDVPGYLAVGAIVAVLFTLTFLQSFIYRDRRALWEDTLAKNENCSMAHNQYGVLWGAEGKLSEAIKHYRRSLECDPRNDIPMRNLGECCMTAGDFDEAL